jgi:Uncharacterized alpha/beta hydrolase domain (DUF2235)
LALDENRTPFAPAVWERPSNIRTDLRQVWFPGAHSNVGGGYPDQGLANVSMAWMMDQLVSIGIAFEDTTIDRLFQENASYYFDQHQKSKSASNSSTRKSWTQWAISPVYNEHKPVRPWGLGEIDEPATGFYRLAGKTIRTPGMYRRVDPDTGLPTAEFLANTNERIHRSVRIRLELQGLGYNDVGSYRCPALLKEGPWRLQRMRVIFRNSMSDRLTRSPSRISGEIEPDQAYSWAWEFVGPKEDAPPEVIMVEEPLGPYERRLLLLNKGEPEVFLRSFGSSHSTLQSQSELYPALVCLKVC